MKKKILFINDLISAGGVEIMMQKLIENMDMSVYDITVMSAFYDRNFKKMYKRGVHYVSIEPRRIMKRNGIISRINNKIAYLKNNQKIKNTIQATDVVVLMAIKTGAVAKWVADMPCKRKIAWLHGDLSVQNIDLTSEERNSLKNFENIVCVADTVKSSAVAVWGDNLNYIVRYNPIDTDAIMKKSEEQIDESVTTKGLLFVTVGRLSEPKAYDRLVKVCSKLNNDYDFELWIVGGGDKRNELERMIDELGVKNVKLLGNKDNPYPYIKAGDWFISSSRYEGFSLVSQEAVVLEKPIIATECSGVRELLGDNEYGIVVDNNEDALYRGMKRILENTELTKIYTEKVKCRKDFVNLHQRINDIVELF